MTIPDIENASGLRKHSPQYSEHQKGKAQSGAQYQPGSDLMINFSFFRIKLNTLLRKIAQSRTSPMYHLQGPAAAAAAKSLQSCPTLCDPIDCSPPGSPVPGILQVRTRSPSPRAWRPDFPGAAREAPCPLASPSGSGCLSPENPRDGGAWWAAVYGVAQSRT